MGATNYDVSILFGYYDVNLKFSGETAKLSFVKVEDIEVDHTRLNFSIQNGFTSMPYEKSDKKLVYKALPLMGKQGFLFQNSVDGTMYAWMEKQPEVTNSNPSTTVFADPDDYAVFNLTDGHYDVTVEYNADYTSANVSFAKSVIPQEIATYSGDLYMFGEISQGVVGDPKCKFTCLQPGLYEWKGDLIDSAFRIMGTDETIPGTSLPPYFGAPIYSDLPALDVNSDYLIQINGTAIPLPDAMYEIQNPVVTLDLRNLTLMVTGEYVRHNIDLKDLSLMTSDYISRHPDSVEGNYAKFQEVDFTDITGFVLNYRGKISFANSSTEGPIVSDDNLEVTIDAQPYNESYFVTTNLSDKYDVLVILNEAQTAVNVKFIKYDPTAVNEIVDSQTGVQITGYAGGISIANAEEGMEIAVYSIDGSVIGKYTATGERMNIDLSQKGIYIVRAGNSSFKVNI